MMKSPSITIWLCYISMKVWSGETTSDPFVFLTLRMEIIKVSGPG